MPLRPTDAVFVHPERRLYVVYYRGQLWQLPRMKIDTAAWLRRQPYSGNTNGLYLSSQQAISDPILAQQLRTLNLPAAIRGSTLPRFEAWWEVQGFSWLSQLLDEGRSPLAAHQSPSKLTESTATKVDGQSLLAIENINIADASNKNTSNVVSDLTKNSANKAKDTQQITTSNVAHLETDVFSNMLAELTDEILQHRSSFD